MLTYVMQSSIKRLAFKAQSEKGLADIMDLHILRKLYDSVCYQFRLNDASAALRYLRHFKLFPSCSDKDNPFLPRGYEKLIKFTLDKWNQKSW